MNNQPIPGGEALPLSVVLVSPRNPLNIGAVARAMSNLGFRDLRLVDAYEVAFQEARSAVNAEWLLREARCFPTLSDAIADCVFVAGASGIADRDLKIPVHPLEQGAEHARDAARRGRVALVFGSEKYGLSREDISHCHELVHIPTRPAHDSMNLGQAAAVCLYELVRERELVRTTPELLPLRKQPQPALAASLDLLHRLLFQLLKDSGYVHRTVEVSAEEKLRQFLLRLNLSVKDATLMLGMVRQVQLVLEDEDIRERTRNEWRKSDGN